MRIVVEHAQGPLPPLAQGQAGQHPGASRDQETIGAAGCPIGERARQAGGSAAFERTTADPDFLAEAERLNFEVNPVSANQLEALLAEAYATPKDVIAKATKAMSE
jgi:hypothetical protein